MIDWLPKNISTYGADIDHLLYLIFWLGIGWFILAEFLIFYFALRYRHRRGVKAQYVRGETWRELKWILVPCAIILALDLWIDEAGTSAWAKVTGTPPSGALEIQIAAKQYNWQMFYPGPDGAFGTGDDFDLFNELHVPIHTPIKLAIGSEDVLHSFFIPTVRLKMDVLPGRITRVWFEATETGTYELACAELCGFGHYTMRGHLIVHTPEGYQAWLEEKAVPQEDEKEWRD